MPDRMHFPGRTKAERDVIYALARRCEEHVGIWDSRMDEEIARVLGWTEEPDGWHAVGDFFSVGKLRKTGYAVEVPAFTRSLDAGMTLLGPLGYPLWTCQIDTRSHGKLGFTFTAEVTVPSREAQGHSTRCSALAVCAAALRAMTFYGEAMDRGSDA